MSIIKEAQRQRIAAEILKHKDEMVKISTNIVNDIILRKQKINSIRKEMEDNPDIFDAGDLADLDSIEQILFEKVQEVYDIVKNS